MYVMRVHVMLLVSVFARAGSRALLDSLSSMRNDRYISGRLAHSRHVDNSTTNISRLYFGRLDAASLTGSSFGYNFIREFCGEI